MATDAALTNQALLDALLDALVDALRPYMPTLYGNIDASAKQKAIEILADDTLAERVFPLTKSIDFSAPLSQEDKRHVALVVKRIMLHKDADWDMFEGTIAGGFSEDERVALTRVFTKATPVIMAYMVMEGAPAIARELVGESILVNDEVLQQFLDGTKDIQYANMSEDDERRAVAFATSLIVEDDEPEQPQQEPPQDEQPKKVKPKRTAEEGDIVLASFTVKGIDRDGNVTGTIAAALSAEQRTGITRVIHAAKPKSLTYNMPAKAVDMPFGDLVLANDETVRAFLDATQGTDYADMSETDEARAVKIAKRVFFGEEEEEDEKEHEKEEEEESILAGLNEDEVSMVKKLVTRGMVAFSTLMRFSDTMNDEELAKQVDVLVENHNFVSAWRAATKGITISGDMSEEEQDRIVLTVTGILLNDGSDSD